MACAPPHHRYSQVRKFDKFLKDNDAKRMCANRKALEEVKLGSTARRAARPGPVAY